MNSKIKRIKEILELGEKDAQKIDSEILKELVELLKTIESEKSWKLCKELYLLEIFRPAIDKDFTLLNKLIEGSNHSKKNKIGLRKLVKRDFPNE